MDQVARSDSNTQARTSSSRTATTISRPITGRSRPRTAATSTGYGENEIVCTITESRGISPTVGLSFVNISTSEAVLCQFADTQTYARTCQKIKVFSPSDIVYMSTAADSKLISIIRENIQMDSPNILMQEVDRRYWSDSASYDYVQHLAFPEDLESLKTSIAGNYFASCCFAAAMKYIELCLDVTFASQTLRIRFEPPEGSVMIDLSTISSLELIQNLQNSKSKDCLFGILNQTLTKMGARMLRSNVLQPSTDLSKIGSRQEALHELVTKEDMFSAVRIALEPFVDTDKVLTALIIIPRKIDFQYMEQSVNNVLSLKTFVDAIRPLWQALSGATSQELQKIRNLCASENYLEIEELIRYALNDDVGFSQQAVELRNQRVYAIRAGVNGFLDVARQTYKEINQDIFDMIQELHEQLEIEMTLKYEPARQYFLRISTTEFENKPIPEVFINIFKHKKVFECQTLDLVKMNQKMKDAHNEVVSMSDRSIQALIDQVRSKIHPLFKISEAIAMIDMFAGMAHLITIQDYVKPEILDTLAIRAGRHPILETIQKEKFIANDVYATRQKRFQIITGCNMSGKSTYIRMIALMTIMAQIGCFVPAGYASFPIVHQLFARLSSDDNIEANVSTFASEMKEMAFILHNIESRSIVIIDELGRGTSTRDGLAIAIAIAEALISSNAFVWFVTHFRDLARILAERAGVVNLHLSVDMTPDLSQMKMKYKISDGYEEEKFYGLALARVIDLPQEVIEVATAVSAALHERNEARKTNPRALAIVRRRKLVLNLREQLIQARQSNLPNEDLKAWLKRLQDEFIVRMSAIDAEAKCDISMNDSRTRSTSEQTATEENDFGSRAEDMAQKTRPVEQSSPRSATHLSSPKASHPPRSQLEIRPGSGADAKGTASDAILIESDDSSGTES